MLTYLSSLAERGTCVFYTPGNHDHFLRGNSLLRDLIERCGSIEIAEEFVFEGVTGRRFLVTHGDQFDKVETGARWLSLLASAVYEVLLSADHFVNRFRSRDDRSPYVLTAAVKHRVKRLIRFVSNYENAIRRHAEQADCEGVICGHIHTPQLVERDGFLYGNSGDWVEHCTALVEHNDGSLVLKSFYGDRVLAKVFGNDGLSVTAAAQRTSVRTIQSNPIWLERDNDLVGVLTDTDC